MPSYNQLRPLWASFPYDFSSLRLNDKLTPLLKTTSPPYKQLGKLRM
ncbi:MAG TPA: hypothetical protein PKN57_11845 [Saprospiraceae bacterium]|nr:hypothetical protein [Saprospiraceae bacterium]MCC6688263.1 hypothetical protein [Saprospiraceae bacterium]HMV24496.1 hypothetical protein [Saprospiraceae bacterium]HMX85909.1 hypothetical protein [Saprospiraceae bacterium]HMZ74305.1 hypothetical protein [Saprospiraceae bacterium]